MTNPIYDINLLDIKGKPFELSQFKGKKILLVNTASACGLTPQYAQLQELHLSHGDTLAVVGLPCNDFGGQEPGTADEIVTFCETHFSVTFPLTEKVIIKGANISPIYQYLTKKEMNDLQDSEVSWNFQKYLIDENGFLEAVFAPTVEVISDEFLKNIE
jgi:glutathione peroxidase